jgi:hypothetical protein
MSDSGNVGVAEAVDAASPAEAETTADAVNDAESSKPEAAVLRAARLSTHTTAKTLHSNLTTLAKKLTHSPVIRFVMQREFENLCRKFAAIESVSRDAYRHDAAMLGLKESTEISFPYELGLRLCCRVVWTALTP